MEGAPHNIGRLKRKDMGTQPLERESSLRKPSRIGEEIRKELEKRGLRAPKTDRSKPNGKKGTSSVEVPFQITVTEDSQEEIDIEVKPVDQIDEGESVEEDREAASEIEMVADENEEAELAVESIENGEGLQEGLQEGPQFEVQDEAPIVVEELEDAAELEESVAKEDLVDTKPLDSTEKSEDVESEEISEEMAFSEPILLPPPQTTPEDLEDDQPTAEMHEAPDFDILPLEEPEETEVDFGPLVTVEEFVTEPIQPPSDEELIEEQHLEDVSGEKEAKPISNELPETAELDNGTVDVLKSYRNVTSPSEFDFDQADKSDVIESLLSIASHELRSPLQAISGFLELLVNRGASDIRQEEQFLSIAYRECNHLADIVADLEAASLIESGKFNIRSAPFSMDHLLQSCIQRFNQPEWEGQIFLTDARLKDLPDLYGDEIFLRQALNNLISVVLRTLRSEQHVFIRPIVDEYDLILQVVGGEDNPSEVTLPDMRAARGEFYDITQEGLGIFVARHIIEVHGGVLMAEGTELEGLTYTIQLPLKPRTESRGTVLITEDNTHAALLMEYALERDGYIPIKATNGLEALEIIANDSVDLVILDVVLPGMDGFEICYRMRSSPETASIPVVIVSAKTGDENRAKALRVGADAYFKKPLVLADLLWTMDKLLENGSMNVADEELEKADPE
jgi:CheY-like chemotaxis protein